MVLPDPRMCIQAGLGVNVSDERMARYSIGRNYTATVSGVMLPHVFRRIVNLENDRTAEYRRILRTFPDQEMVARVWEYCLHPESVSEKPEKTRRNTELEIIANFTVVALAKEGHSGNIAINYLEKVGPHLANLYGAMLAGVDYVIMGAGKITQIPGILDLLAEHKMATYRIKGLSGDELFTFNPQEFLTISQNLHRPTFLAIASNLTIAKYFTSKSTGKVQGIIFEGHAAGGHNGPECKGLDYAEVRRELKVPFWVAGGLTPQKVKIALESGATGIQVGTMPAYSRQSNFLPEFAALVRRLAYRGELQVVTQHNFSPTGYDFKTAMLPGTLADPAVYRARTPRCISCGLGDLNRIKDTELVRVCRAAPEKMYLSYGGTQSQEGYACLGSALMAAVGLIDDIPCFSCGEDTEFMEHLMSNEDDSYDIQDGIDYYFSEV